MNKSSFMLNFTQKHLLQYCRDNTLEPQSNSYLVLSLGTKNAESQTSGWLTAFISPCLKESVIQSMFCMSSLQISFAMQSASCNNVRLLPPSVTSKQLSTEISQQTQPKVIYMSLLLYFCCSFVYSSLTDLASHHSLAYIIDVPIQ